MTSDQGLRPFASVILGVALFSLMDATMKGAALAAGAYSAMLLRSFVGLALTIPIYFAGGQPWPGRAALKVHVTRGVVSSGMAFTFFWAITQMPLAEAIALSFIAPLIALYLAAVLLGEKIKRRAIAASLVGIIGVLVIAAERLHDSQDSHRGWLGLASILTSALLYAWNLALQRQQALLARPLEVATFQNAIVSVTLILFGPWFLKLPGAPATWGLIAAASLLSIVAGMLFAWAYARAEAQVLVPLEYSAFVWACLFGWLFFAESVRPATLLGVGLIVVACLIAAPRKRPEPAAV